MKTYRIRDHPTLILLIFIAWYLCLLGSAVGIPIAEFFSKNSSMCFDFCYEKEFYEVEFCKKIKNWLQRMNDLQSQIFIFRFDRLFWGFQ